MPKVKKQKDREKDKDRKFVFMLYPDNSQANLTLFEIKAFKYNALAVLHDKDKYTESVVDEETGELLHAEGETKKPHYHVYIEFPNPRYISGVSSELGIDEHLIQFCDNKKAYWEYMLHWGTHGGAGKYTYDVDDFIGALKSTAINALTNEPPEVKFTKLFMYIKSYDGYLTYSLICEWAIDNGYIGFVLSKCNQIKELIYDHNKRYCDALNKK